MLVQFGYSLNDSPIGDTMVSQAYRHNGFRLPGKTVFLWPQLVDSMVSDW